MDEIKANAKLLEDYPDGWIPTKYYLPLVLDYEPVSACYQSSLVEVKTQFGKIMKAEFWLSIRWNEWHKNGELANIIKEEIIAWRPLDE